MAVSSLGGAFVSSPFYGKVPEDGLHVLKDAWDRKLYMGEQSRALAERLSEAIEATARAAHERTQGFQLSRRCVAAMHDRSRERRLEAALLTRWNRPEMCSIPGGWDRLVAFQVPLFAQEQKEQWGYVDLLGVTASGVPVVVELKKAPKVEPDGKTGSSETPLRMVLEAAAYAIALRKNWGLFRSEWVARLKELAVTEDIVSDVPDCLTTVPLVAAAPASFWMDWLPVTAKGKTVTGETWNSFRSLLEELNRAMLPVTFLSISGHEQDVEGLAVQPLIGFPPTL